MASVPVQPAGTSAVEVPLDDVLGAAPNRIQPIDADDNPADFAGTQLVVVGRGEVLMGNPFQFDKAG